MHPRLWSLVVCGFALVPVAMCAQGEDPDARAKLDPKRIINRSMNFLTAREPDLSAEEHALYEQAQKLMGTQPAAARTLLEGLVEKPKGGEPASPAFDLLLGNFYYADGQTDKAELGYLRAVERYPAFLRAWTNLGVLYYARGQYAKAIPCLTKAIVLGDREGTTLGMMALCLERTGDAVGAELAFIQALAVDPGDVGWMEGLVRVFMQAKQHVRAEIMVRNLIKERPAEARYWRTYAEIMVAAGRKLEAIALLEQTIANGTAGPEELAQLAGLYADENLIPEAALTYGKIEVSAKTLGERRTLQLVRVLTARSEWSKAQALLDELGKSGGEGPEAFLRIQADLLAAQRKWGETRTVLDELLRLNPMDGNALISLGRVYLAERDEVRAILAFEAAIQTDEGAHQASLMLANLELKHRHFERSVSYLEKALSFERNEEIENILTRVRSLVSASGHPQS